MVWGWSLQALPSHTFSDIYNSCSAQSWSSPLCFPTRSSPLLPSKAEIICEQFFATVSNVVRNNNVNDPNGILVDFETAINAIWNVLPQTDIRWFLPSFIELVEAYPTCWITRMLHERPRIWFTVTSDCCFSLRAPTGCG